MFQRITQFWNEHGFITCVILTIIFFLIYWLFFTRHKQDGTYSTTYYYPPGGKLKNEFKRSGSPRGPPQTSKGEVICKSTLESLFQRPFQKIRPSFLYNTVTHENLELDMYNQEINLACEYNGKQHYEYIPYFHQNSRTNFHNQKYRDERKIEMCRKNNIPLIIVPYTIPPEEIPNFIRQEVRRLGKDHFVKR
jgi:hypothetical protein